MGETYHRWTALKVLDAGARTWCECKLCGMTKDVEIVSYSDGTKDLRTIYADPRTGMKFPKAGQCPGVRPVTP